VWEYENFDGPIGFRSIKLKIILMVLVMMIMRRRGGGL
jgi:hypothetical protein